MSGEFGKKVVVPGGRKIKSAERAAVNGNDIAR
jgi:hypothetical protein